LQFLGTSALPSSPAALARGPVVVVFAAGLHFMRHEAGLCKDTLMARLVAWVSVVMVALCCGSAVFAQEEDVDDNDGYIAPPKIVSPK
jgi:hypothetical protein